MLKQATIGVLICGEKTRITLYAEGGISVERHVVHVGFVIWDDFPEADVQAALQSIAQMASGAALNLQGGA